MFCSEFHQLSKNRAVEFCVGPYAQHIKLGHQIACMKVTYRIEGSIVAVCMLRIERSANDQVVFTLSGRMQTQEVEEFQRLLVAETPGQALMFNLRDVTLVNQDAVTFLAECEANGIELESCPLYIRNWIDQEKGCNRESLTEQDDTK
jgi:hypothetical protein